LHRISSDGVQPTLSACTTGLQTSLESQKAETRSTYEQNNFCTPFRELKFMFKDFSQYSVIQEKYLTHNVNSPASEMMGPAQRPAHAFTPPTQFMTKNAMFETISSKSMNQVLD